jgi:hypothetical protein
MGVLKINDAWMGQDRQAAGVKNQPDSLFTGYFKFINVGGFVFSQVKVKGPAEIRYIAFFHKQLGNVGAACLAGAKTVFHLVQGNVKSQIIEFFNDPGISVGPGLCRTRQGVVQRTVINGKSVSKHMNATQGFELRRGGTRNLNTGYKFKRIRMNEIFYFQNSGNGIVVGQCDCLNTGVPGQIKNLSGRQGAVRGSGMCVKINQNLL